MPLFASNANHNVSGPYKLCPLDELVPPFNGKVIYAPQPQCDIHVGNFVMLQDKQVVTVLSDGSPHELRGRLYSPHPNPRSWSHLTMAEQRVLDGVHELVKTSTYLSFRDDDIVGHALVLPIKVLIDSGIQGVGMENLFVCCERMDKNGLFHELTGDEIPDFAGNRAFRHNRCTGKIFFTSILQVQDLFKSCLNRYGDKQGNVDRSSSKINLDPDVWFYMKQRLLHHSPSIPMKKTNNASSVKSSIHNGCVQSSIRSPKCVTRLRLLTRNHLRALQHILGTAIAFGLRVRRPKISDPPRRVNENDSFNVVRVLSNDDGTVDENAFAPTTYGIDLMYDETFHWLTVYVRYEKWVFTTNRSGKPRRCPLDSLEDMLMFSRRDKSNNSTEASNSDDSNGDSNGEEADSDDDSTNVSEVKVKIGSVFLIEVRNDVDGLPTSTATAFEVRANNGDGTYRCVNLQDENDSRSMDHEMVVNAILEGRR